VALRSPFYSTTRLFATASRAFLHPIRDFPQVAIKKMKKKFFSWEECMQLREIKVS
jgi:hypothetical protein